MKVLYVVGSCLLNNTSANMSHNSYVQGLIENGCEVDIIMADESWGERDQKLPLWEEAKYHVFKATSIKDNFRNFGRGLFHNSGATTVKTNQATTENRGTEAEHTDETNCEKRACTRRLRDYVKQLFYIVFPQDPLYPLEEVWLKQARKYKSDIKYDLVISNSSPAVSHRLVEILLEGKRIQCDRWIQIWEDPWYFDLYGGHDTRIQEEEHRLLKCASEIYYVSPLTTEYQKRYYADCADKMHFVPLPAMKYDTSERTVNHDNVAFGYFGDYYSQTRNLLPFYKALTETDYQGYIFGDSDLTISSTDKVTVSGRVTLDRLEKIQADTDVLVHLCNLRGGQIPGKIYHYSLTDKPILFILDGTQEEIEIIHDYFKRYDRYYFCLNSTDSIIGTMQLIARELRYREFYPVDEFTPKSIVRQLIRREG